MAAISSPGTLNWVPQESSQFCDWDTVSVSGLQESGTELNFHQKSNEQKRYKISICCESECSVNECRENWAIHLRAD
jgi:SH3-like domain-containing protein